MPSDEGLRELPALSDIDAPGDISPQPARPGYVAKRIIEIRETDPRVLAVADAMRRTYRRKTGKGMLPCQSIILAHAAVAAIDAYNNSQHGIPEKR